MQFLNFSTCYLVKRCRQLVIADQLSGEGKVLKLFSKIVTEESDAKKAKARRSRSAPSNQPSIADLFAKRYAIIFLFGFKFPCNFSGVFHSLPEPNRAWLLVVYFSR